MADQTVSPGTPPLAPRRPEVWHRPTGDVSDPWAWLRNRDDPDTIGYLESENQFAESWFAPLDELR